MYRFFAPYVRIAYPWFLDILACLLYSAEICMFDPYHCGTLALEKEILPQPRPPELLQSKSGCKNQR